MSREDGIFLIFRSEGVLLFQNHQRGALDDDVGLLLEEEGVKDFLFGRGMEAGVEGSFLDLYFRLPERLICFFAGGAVATVGRSAESLFSQQLPHRVM